MAGPAAVAWRPVVTEIVRERLDAGEAVWLPVRGRSMRPLLARAARIRVAPARRACVGDLLAYECEGAIVCHRVLGRRGARVLTRADRHGAGPELVTPRQVLGVVVAVARDGAVLDLTTRSRRVRARLAAARSLLGAAWASARRRVWPRA